MVEPRVLISIDYESWVAMRQSEFNYAPSDQRLEMDDGFTADSLDELLDILNGKVISFYLLGEIAAWYPQVPEKITAQGHELGFHGHFHRSLLDVADLEKGLQLSGPWIKK
jgi:peptidoglycan/xylan/chitin deacetylase (PgdA/CDA1 family)